MKRVLNFGLVVIVVLAFVITSCKKDDGDLKTGGNPNTELPTNEGEAFELITKKWELTNLADYNYIELTNDSVYIVDKVSVLKSTAVDSEQITGAFTVSADGKTITLIGFGTMTIKQVNENLIVITVVLENGTDLGEITCDVYETLSDSDKTKMLCKSWYAVLENGGLVFNETCNGEMVEVYNKWTFTNYGSIIMEGFTFSETRSPDGAISCSYSKVNTACTWNWTDATQTKIIIRGWVQEGQGDAPEGEDVVVDEVVDVDVIADVALSDNVLTISNSDGSMTFKQKSYSSNGGSNSGVTTTQLIGLWRYVYTDGDGVEWPYELKFSSDNKVSFYTSESGNTYEIGTWSLDGNSVIITDADSGSTTGSINNNTLTVSIGELGSKAYTKVE